MAMMPIKGFAEEAKEAFAFLANAGFNLVAVDPDRLYCQLQYQSDKAFVTIAWDRRLGELDVYLGLRSKINERGGAFALDELLALAGVDVPEARRPFQVADESRLRPFLDKLARDIQDHAQLALAGDRMFFHRLDAFRHRQAQAYMNHRRIRAEAEEAWRRREFDRVTALYATMEGYLTESEKAKLAYARKN